MVTIRVPFFRRADFLIPFAIATALIISVSVASAVDLERGLVAYYSFDDCSAKDLSGNGNDGIIYGAKCVDGKFGKALRFDGVDDYVNVGDVSSLEFASGQSFSFAYWFKGTGHSTENDGIITKGYGAGDYNLVPWYLVYYRTDGHVGLYLRDPAGNSYDSSPDGPIIDDGNWHFLVHVYDADAGEIRNYDNGRLVNTLSGVTKDAYGTNTGRFILMDHYQRYTQGIIDEVRVYNKALSADEIKELYERGVTPRPKLAIEMDIDTSLKQGEVRKGTIRVENLGNSDAKSVKVRLFSESLGIDVEKSYAKIPSGEAREFLFEVSANEAGTFKLSAYAEYWDDKGNKYVETADKFVHVEAVVLPTSQPTSQAPKTPEARETARPAGFYAIFASLFMAVSYFLIRLKGKKN